MVAPARLLPRQCALHAPRAAAAAAAQRTAHRPYHSYDHPPPPGAFGDAEKAILAAAYKHIPQHGFSQRALGLGAREAGYLDISAGLLPDGPFSLIKYHLVAQREALAARNAEMFKGDETAGTAHRVETLTWERLMGNILVLDRWQEVG
jgi:ubiquinone biosynthesis protein COQ9